MDAPALKKLLSRLDTFAPGNQHVPALTPIDVSLIRRGFTDGFAHRWDPPPFAASIAAFNVYKAACIIGHLERHD